MKARIFTHATATTTFVARVRLLSTTKLPVENRRALAAAWQSSRALFTTIAAISLGLLTSTAMAQTYVIQSTFGTFGTSSGQFRLPYGVAIDPATRNIVVSDQLNNRLQIFDSNGVYLSQFGSPGSGNGQFNVPVGVAIDPITHHIVVADLDNNRVEIFDSTGAYLSQFGSTGTGNGQFTAPDGVAIDPTTHDIVVVDNARVEIFDSTGNYLSQFGSPGTGNGQFSTPIGVAIDPTTRYIVVADYANNRVQIFDSTGAYLSQFGSPGTGDGQFHGAVFVAIDATTHNIFATDAGGNRVEIFDSTGLYLGQFGSVGEPEGLAIDPTTRDLVVVDVTNDRAEIFAPTAGELKYQGLWWAAPAGSESGWGINLAHQGDIIFAAWFTYDVNGKGLWLVMTATKTAPGIYSGALYTTTGPAFNAVPFNPAQVVGTAVGIATLTFADLNDGTFAYTVYGISQTKKITREVFGTLPACATATASLSAAANYQDLWWASPAGSESGWGIGFAHEGDIIFATWFTYDLDHSPMWLVVTARKTAPGVYSGMLYRTTGPGFNAMPFNPANVVGTPVGTATFTFADGNNASFAYTVNGISQIKQITREVFQSPGTLCQ